MFRLHFVFIDFAVTSISYEIFTIIYIRFILCTLSARDNTLTYTIHNLFVINIEFRSNKKKPTNA